MKSFIAFAVLIVGISALPQKLIQGVSLSNERIVTDSIASAIEDISQSIKDVGLDPLHIEFKEGSYDLPVPVIFNAAGIIDDFLFTGLSNIVITRLSFNVITLRLRLDLSIPLIEAGLKQSNCDVILFGESYNAAAAGRFAIKDITIQTDIRASVGIISGISIRSMDVNFKLGGIDSELDVSVLGRNLSNEMNTFLGETIPTTLNNYEKEINELLAIVLIDIINDNL